MKNTLIDMLAMIGAGTVLSAMVIGFHILKIYRSDQGKDSETPIPK